MGVQVPPGPQKYICGSMEEFSSSKRKVEGSSPSKYTKIVGIRMDEELVLKTSRSLRKGFVSSSLTPTSNKMGAHVPRLWRETLAMFLW